MRYALLIKPHANVRYRDSLKKLAICELNCLLNSIGVQCTYSIMETGMETFLFFDIDTGHEPNVVQTIVRHSGICFMAQVKPDGSFIPLFRENNSFIPQDLPHVLKYKGKTNADFTQLMINCARSLLPHEHSSPLNLYDPMCGKATTLFCGLFSGMNAYGNDVDKKAIEETVIYTQKALQLHKTKHKHTSRSLTVPQSNAIKADLFEIRDKDSDAVLTCQFAISDALRSDKLYKKDFFDLVVSDLPYGIQHAPHEGKKIPTLSALVEKTAEACYPVMKHGGVAAFSFNVNTLSKKDALQALETSGLVPVTDPPYDDFSHWVEQAITRDIVFAKKG